MININPDDLGDDVDRVQYIKSVTGVSLRDVLTGQENRWVGSTADIGDSDKSDRWYVPVGVRRRIHPLQMIREVRSLLNFMPASVIGGSLGILLPRDSKSEIGIGLSKLDDKGFALYDPQLVEATVDPKTGKFIIVRDITQQYKEFAQAKGIVTARGMAT